LGTSKRKSQKGTKAKESKALQAYAGAVLKDLNALSEKEVLARLLEHPAPRQLVQRLPSGDFYWLVKKMGEDGALQLLRLASTEQWQYVLDLELWRRDRVDLEEATSWLGRLQLADPARLTEWLFTEGQALGYYYLFRNIRVEIRQEDEVYDLEQGFVTLDGLFYIKVRDPGRMETIESMLRTMADADFLRYQSLLSGLAGVLPAELEEDMYRMKNIRLAEHGFLPREEALQVYAALSPEKLGLKTKVPQMVVDGEAGALELAPHSPLIFVEDQGLLTHALSRVADPVSMDRLRLEFAGLCNRVLSADGLPTQDMEVLKRACRKSAGYINLILEKMCGEDIEAARELLESNPLLSLFRAGFGAALNLKWEAERWLKKSWFKEKGLKFDFWGEAWGYTLSALVARRPLYYDMDKGEGEYRDFEHEAELSDVRAVLHRVVGLDALLAQMTKGHAFDSMAGSPPGPTFHPLLFTMWARKILNLAPSLEGISLNQARAFFRFLRSGDKRAPYRMAAYEDVFVNDIMAAAAEGDAAAAATLKDTLALIWQGFCQEYEQVPLNALDRRFSPYIAIRPSVRSPAQ